MIVPLLPELSPIIRPSEVYRGTTPIIAVPKGEKGNSPGDRRVPAEGGEANRF